MRRTTICHSNRAVLLALVAGLLGGRGLRAQDTTQAAADTQVPASHTVTQGETLWSISQLYFSDALLWPEIYRVNTAVVEDPHWIYPGEVLYLTAPTSVAQAARDTTAVSVAQPAAADTVQAEVADTVTGFAIDTAGIDTAVVEEPPPAGPAETQETIFDRDPGRFRTKEVQEVLRAYANQPYRPLRRGEFYAAGFLSERERLPWGGVLGATAVPAIPRLTEHTTAMVFEEIAVRRPGNASYHVGDSLLIARLGGGLPAWGDVVVPLGVARVTEVQRHQLLAEVIMQFGRIRDGSLAMPLEPFKDPGAVRPVPVERGLEARVITHRDPHPIANAQQILFLDKGRADGVVPGDLFEIYRPASNLVGGASEQPLVVVEIVHTRQHSCSGLVLGITHPHVPEGTPARLIRKMPS
jgi:LysM domain-containing protein